MLAWTLFLIVMLTMGLALAFFPMEAFGWWPEDLTGIFRRYSDPLDLIRQRLTFIRAAAVEFGVSGLMLGLGLWWIFGHWFRAPRRTFIYAAAAGTAGGLVGAIISTAVMVILAESMPHLSGRTVTVLLWMIEGFVAGAALSVVLESRLRLRFGRRDLWFGAWPLAFTIQQASRGLAIVHSVRTDSDALLWWSLFLFEPLLMAFFTGVALFFVFRGPSVSSLAQTGPTTPPPVDNGGAGIHDIDGP